jgi:hypothetical protein
VPEISVAAPQVKEPEVKKPVISHKNLNIGNSLTSLINKGAAKDKADAEEQIPAKDLKRNVFTLEALQSSWQHFTQLIEARGKQSLYNTLKASVPELADDFQINFKVFNSVQENDMEQVLTELSMKLRTELQNDVLKINIIASKDDGERKPYSNKEKYVHMVQINPIIEQLRTKLDLEI